MYGSGIFFGDMKAFIARSPNQVLRTFETAQVASGAYLKNLIKKGDSFFAAVGIGEHNYDYGTTNIIIQSVNTTTFIPHSKEISLSPQ
jgi:hypothetical protein